MKKTIALLLMAVLFFGCATAPPEENIATETAPVATETVEAAPKEPVIIQVDVPHVLTETRFFRDGSVDINIVTEYDEENTRILSEKTYDSFENLSKQTSYIYEGDTLKKEFLGADGKLISYEIVTFDADGRITSEASFSDSDDPKMSTQYTWDVNGIISLTVNDGSGIMLSRIDYTYENGLNVKSTLVGTDEAVRNTFVREYDGKGMLLKETSYNRNNNAEKAVVSVYEGGFLVAEEHLNNAGGLSRKYLFVNDEKGSPIKITMENSRGAVMEMVELSYFYTVEEKVLEE